MKFIPLPSSSPRSLRRDRIDGDPPVTLELVYDPRDGKKYLSLGVGDRAVRRSWLSVNAVTGLSKSVLSMLKEMEKTT